MRSDPMGFSEVIAPLTADVQALGARELRRIGLILAPHLAGRCSGPARLLRSTRGPVFWPSEAAAGHPAARVTSNANSILKEFLPWPMNS